MGRDAMDAAISKPPMSNRMKKVIHLRALPSGIRIPSVEAL